jgi:DNA modification methylase/ParB-like chromosome segregation protein Spo0J
MRTIPISSIIIKPDRQRQEFAPEAMQELIDSIRDLGLMHPPVLRQEAGGLVLVAGERRLRAMQDIFDLGDSFFHDGRRFAAEACEVPYTDIGNLSLLEAEEAELDENLKRQNLTWQEHAAAVSRLHTLRGAQKQAAAEPFMLGDMKVVPPPAAAQTVAETALELLGRSDGSFQDRVRKELIVARHLDNPEVAKAKSADEAFKILKQQEQRSQNIALAQVVGATFNADKHMLLNRDCLDYMREQVEIIESGHPEEAFDIILTDPPYGMGADNFGDAAGKMTGIQHHYDDSPESWNKLMQEWTLLSFKLAKPQAHAYVFCDIDNFPALKLMMQKAGWYVFRTPLTVFKQNSGRVPLPDRGPRRQSEWILYAIKGDKPVTHIYPDVISVAGDDNLGHGAQKPVALALNLLQRSARPGDRVLDTFAGTGFVFPAAHNLKCTCVGTEMDAGSYGIALSRIRSLKALETPAIL